MNIDRLFFKANSIFCFYVGLTLLARGFSRLDTEWIRVEPHEVDKYFDLILRHFAQQSMYFAILAGYVPAMMLISLMVGFYLYLHERSKVMAFTAFLSGIALSGLWIARRVLGSAWTVMAAKYIETSSAVAREELLAEAKNLYYYDMLSQQLNSGTSLLAYALFGLLLIRGRGVEFLAGSLFLISSLSLIVYQISSRTFLVLESTTVLILPALAFICSSILFWRHKTYETKPG